MCTSARYMLLQEEVELVSLQSNLETKHQQTPPKPQQPTPKHQQPTPEHQRPTPPGANSLHVGYEALPTRLCTGPPVLRTQPSPSPYLPSLSPSPSPRPLTHWRAMCQRPRCSCAGCWCVSCSAAAMPAGWLRITRLGRRPRWHNACDWSRAGAVSRWVGRVGRCGRFATSE